MKRFIVLFAIGLFESVIFAANVTTRITATTLSARSSRRFLHQGSAKTWQGREYGLACQIFQDYKDSEECQGRNILTCKDCNFDNLQNVVHWTSGLQDFGMQTICFDTGHITYTGKKGTDGWKYEGCYTRSGEEGLSLTFFPCGEKSPQPWAMEPDGSNEEKEEEPPEVFIDHEIEIVKNGVADNLDGHHEYKTGEEVQQAANMYGTGQDIPNPDTDYGTENDPEPGHKTEDHSTEPEIDYMAEGDALYSLADYETDQRVVAGYEVAMEIPNSADPYKGEEGDLVTDYEPEEEVWASGEEWAIEEETADTHHEPEEAGLEIDEDWVFEHQTFTAGQILDAQGYRTATLPSLKAEQEAPVTRHP